MEEACVGGSCNLCQREVVEEIHICRWIDPKGIPTPFHREIGDDTILAPTDYPRDNYEEYELFCYRTRLLPWIKRFKVTYDGNFTLYEDLVEGKDVMHLYLEVIDGSQTVALTEEQHNTLKQASEAVYRYNKNHCLLFSSEICVANNLDLTKGLPNPVSWLSSVLAYVDSLPDILDPILDEGNLYVRLDGTGDYSQEYQYYHGQLLKELYTMRSLGYMVLDPLTEQDFIERWGLSLIEQRMYAPNWRDNRIAPDILAFLYQRKETKLVLLPLEDDVNLIHNIAKALSSKETFHLFSSLTLTFEADSILEVQEVVSLVYESYQDLPENVVTIPISSPLLKDKWVERIREIYPEAEISYVVYLTDNELPYTLSLSLPGYVDFSSLEGHL